MTISDLYTWFYCVPQTKYTSIEFVDYQTFF